MILSYLVRRLGQLALVLFIGSVAVWIMIYAVPGSPELAIAGPDATAEQLAAVRERLGLDRPLPVQYLSWVGGVLTGDLGSSLASGKAVTELLGQRIPATFQLIVFAVVIGLVIALPAGVFAAWRPRSLTARAAGIYQVVLLAFPSFWLGIILIWLFGLHFRVLPTMSNYVPFMADPVGAFRNTLLPALTLGLFMAAVLVRFVRSAVSEELAKPHIRAVRAKGASEGNILINHALRNAALPIVTIVGLQLGAFIGGAVVTESVFNYPGIGRLVFVAVSTRDYPVVQGVLMFVVFSFAVINMAVDVIYAALDPRIKVN
ncbi:MAG TPA: ABC transporter permease [Rhizobiaceae bacterium]|nr:ABC transporter permease [Rhizobiaceae bacterium]